MTFEPKKFDEIYDQMVEETRHRLPGMTDFQTGSVLRTMYESFAFEMAVLYEQMHYVYRSAYIDSAEDVHLDQLVEILGIRRNLPDYAEGEVTFERDPGPTEIVIAAGTLVVTEDSEKLPKKAYKVINTQMFPASESELTVKVQAIDRGESQVVDAAAIKIMPLPISGLKAVLNRRATRFTGKQSEIDDDLRRRAKNALITSGRASIIAIEQTLLSLPGVQEVKILERFDTHNYGIVEVFVDGRDLDQEIRKQFLQGQVDRVRAAGVFVKLQAAVKVPVDGIFGIEVNPSLNLSVRDRALLEATVQDEITQYLSEMRLGQSLQFNQLTRRILAIPNVSNLDNFALFSPAIQAEIFSPTDNKIEFPLRASQRLKSDPNLLPPEAQKFTPGTITVLSQAIPVSIKVEIQVKKVNLPDPSIAIDAIQKYFTTSPLKKISIPEITETLTNIKPIKITPENIKLITSPLLFLSKATENKITLSWAEVGKLESIFLYTTILELAGAIVFKPFNTTATIADKDIIKTKLEIKAEEFIDRLKPEEGIDIKALQKNLESAVKDEATVSIHLNDIQIASNEEENTRMSQDTFQIKALEKANLKYVCISSEIESITLTIDQINVNFTPTPIVDITIKATSDINHPVVEQAIKIMPPQESNKSEDKINVNSNIETAIETALKIAIAQIKLPETGKSLVITDVQQSILNAIAPLAAQFNGTLNLTEFRVTAFSNSDGRSQEWKLTKHCTIYVRSIEKITSLTLASPDPITINNSTTSKP